MKEFIENDVTRKLSEICKENDCPNNLVRIRYDELYFDNPDDIGDSLYYSYYDNEWHSCTRTLNKWNLKILSGLNRCFSDGINGMMKHMNLPEKLEFLRKIKG